MRSGERLPTLTAVRKNSLVLLSLITRFCMVILAGESGDGFRSAPGCRQRQRNRVPQDYVTQSGPLREMNGSRVCWRNSCKMRSCRPMLRTLVKTE